MAQRTRDVRHQEHIHFKWKWNSLVCIAMRTARTPNCHYADFHAFSIRRSRRIFNFARHILRWWFNDKSEAFTKSWLSRQAFSFVDRHLPLNPMHGFAFTPPASVLSIPPVCVQWADIFHHYCSIKWTIGISLYECIRLFCRKPPNADHHMQFILNLVIIFVFALADK